MDGLREELEAVFEALIGDTVIYSRTGGGAGSILLITFKCDISIWGWSYWEIRRGDELLATADDDATAIVGKMAQAANRIEGKKLEDIMLDRQCDLILLFNDDIELVIFPYEKEDDEADEFVNWEVTVSPIRRNYYYSNELKLSYGVDFDIIP